MYNGRSKIRNQIITKIKLFVISIDYLRFTIQLQLKIACVNLVAECNLPFSVTEKPSFHELLQLTSGREIEIPSMYEVKSTLKCRYNAMKSQLIEIISKQKYVCLTADIWSSHAQSYFCATVHFINSEMKRESYVLAFREMKYKQTNEQIAQIIRQVLREYEIDPAKVTHIITDGGSNFCKAFKIYGRSIDTPVDAPSSIESDEDDIDSMPFFESDDGQPFYSEIFNLDQDYSEQFHDSESNERLSETDDFESSDEQLSQDNLEDDNISEMPIDSNENINRNDEYETKPLPPHKRCLPHVLNLVGKDFEDALTGKAKTCLMSMMNKLQSLWVFPRKSSQAKTYSKEILGCSLPIPCATRWNSKYDAVSKVLSLGHEKINEYIDALKKNLKSAAHLSKLDKDDWTMINIYVKVMKPIAVSLDRLQGEKESCQGFILPTLYTMKYRLETLEGGNVLKACRDVMLNVIEKRFHSYFKIDYSNRENLLSAVSLPRFKTNFIEGDTDYETAKRILISECKQLSNNVESSENNDDAASQEDDFFVSFASKRTTRRGSLDEIIEDEVKKYLNDPRTENEMLNDYPHVKNVFYRHNTTLSASAAVERVFSQSEIIFTPRRNRLSSTNFECLLLYKLNRKQFITNGYIIK